MAAIGSDHECHVSWAQVGTGHANAWRLLDAGERERARGYRYVPARTRFVLGRGLARLAVAQVAGVEPESVEFTATCRHCGGPHGRLEVPTPDGRIRLSISHSGTRVGVALTWDIPCGLDIEQVALRGRVPPTNALSPAEREAFAAVAPAARLDAFIRTWTRKEAVLKATGDGLLRSPADLTMSAPWQPAGLVTWPNRPPPHTSVHLHDLDVGPRHRASLATLGVPVTVIQHEADICRLAETTAAPGTGRREKASMDATGVLPRFDALDPSVREYPYPAYARLREAGALCRLGPGAFGVTRHRDVVALQRDARLGSEFPARYHHMSVGAGPAADFFQRIMLYRDPPDHARLRKLIGKAFTPAVVRRLRTHIEELVGRLMAPAIEAGRCDIVSTLAYPLPVMVISKLMGIPPAAHDDVRRSSSRLGRAFSAIVPEQARGDADEAVCWLRAYLGRLLDERRASPGDDLLSDLLRAEEDGDTLTHEEIVDNTVFSFFAGFETTVHLITNGVALLLRHPDQLERLRREPSLVPAAVEEFLRFEAPIQGTARLVREPIAIGGRTVRAGRVLVLMLGSANHDGEVFTDPERLDVGREHNPHVTFGGGNHLCLGAFLARTEGQVVFEWLLKHTSLMQLAGDPVREADTPFRAYAALPVAFG